MSRPGIVSGQKVTRVKSRRAREVRQRMTPEERTLWRHVRAHGLAGLHFRRQQAIDGYIVDFYCGPAALVVELDGEVHRAHATSDAARDRALARRGLRVLRIPNDDVRHDLAGVLARIGLAAQAGAADAKSELATALRTRPECHRAMVAYNPHLATLNQAGSCTEATRRAAVCATASLCAGASRGLLGRPGRSQPQGGRHGSGCVTADNGYQAG